MNMKKYFEKSMMDLLTRKNIDGITVGEIIEEVGSCKGTFYKHYVDKYALCCSALQNRVYCDVSPDAESWESFIYQCLTAFEKNAKTVLHAFDSKDVNSARRYHENFTMQYLVKQYVKNGGDLSVTLNIMTLRLYSTAVTELITRWLSGGCKESKEQTFDLICAVTPQTVFKKICVGSM